MQKLLVSNIQEFSLHDGQGIRTTVFFKGCTVRCPWCANPESVKSEREWSFDEKKCIDNDGRCLITNECNKTIARKKAGKLAFEDEITNCHGKALSIVGTYYSQEELYKILINDCEFWQDEGGITFSGGEPFLQLRYCKELLEKLKEKKINIAVETSLFVPIEYVMSAIEYIDFLYVDFKIINKEKCKKVLGGNLDEFIGNLDIIKDSGKNYVARIPIVENITDLEDNIASIIRVISQFAPSHIELFSVHNLATEKYRKLGRKYQKFPVATTEKLIKIKRRIEKETRIRVEVLEI